MKYVFLLSGDYINLAKEEVLGLFDVEKYNLVNRLFIVDLKDNLESINKLSKRLALTKSICKLLFECEINELVNIMKRYDWNSIYRDSFCLRLHNLNENREFIKKTTIKNNKKISNKTRTTSKSRHGRSNPFALLSEKDLAGYIWSSVKNPKVNLENPKTKIELFCFDDKIYCGLLIFENKEDFEARKSHLRPFPSPSSLHPKLARALVNISGIKKDEILLDPFCGTGGFLIEAGLMGIKVIGYDINKIVIKGCVKNLKYYKVKNYKIKNENALNLKDKFDYIVTDLPYGLNTNVILKYEKNWKKHRINLKIQKKNFYKILEKFYLKFLKKLRKKLKKKAVIIFPNYVNYKNLLKSSKFKIEKEFSMYVHRSLSRKIVSVR